MRKRLAAGALAGAMVLGVAGPAAAAPPGLEKKAGEHFAITCPEPIGDVQVIAGSGRSAWLHDRLYHVVEFDLTFTLTSPNGDTEVEEFYKSFGRGPKGELFTCDVDVMFSDPDEGTFTAVGTVTLVDRRAGRR